MATTQKYANSWIPLLCDIWRRLWTPLTQFSFVMYMLLGTVAFGGTAIWVEWCKYDGNLDGIRTAIDTYFPAIGCSAAFQLALAENKKKYIRTFGWVATFVLIAWSFLLLRDTAPASWDSVKHGIYACIAAVIICWIANGLSEEFYDNPDFGEAATGGTTDAQPSGSTSGFRT